MAVAFDAIDAGLFNNDGVSTTFTLAHTCTGSNLTLVVPVVIVHGTSVTGMTYNTVAMTLSSSSTSGSGGRYDTYIYTLIAPATGTHDIVFTVPSPIGGSKQMTMQGSSYTGTNQTAIDSASSTVAATSSPFVLTTTVVAANCWITGACGSADGDMNATPGSGTTYHGAQVGNMQAGDSNGTVGTGSQSLNFGHTNANEISGSIVSIAPPTPIVVLPYKSLLGVGI